MKLSAILMVVFTLNLSATGFSQFSFNANGKTVREIFDIIEKGSNYRFFYNDNYDSKDLVVDLNVNKQNINQILDKLLSSSDYTYKVFENNLIVISLKDNIRELSMSQQNVVKGTVTDAQGNPVVGATISIKGTTRGITSDINGNYIIEPENSQSILVISFIGYTTQEVPLNGRTTLNIELVSETVGLEEVIVIGYGTQKRVNVIGSVGSVGQEEIISAPISGISNALSGRLPGVITMQGSGEPGRDEATIRIRGNATLNVNEPLIIIDGIPGRDLNSINSEDIKSVSVLKDASAGIYGARAANGVLLITTKSGTNEMPATFTYSFYSGFLSPTKLPEMTDAATYATMIRETQSYRSVSESNMKYSLADIAKYESGEYPWTHPNTNWFEAALKDHSMTQHHNLSVSGGTKNISYYGSFGSYLDDGIYTNSEEKYKRNNIKLNLKAQINEYLSVGLDISGNQESRIYPTTATSMIFYTTVRMYPTYPAYWPGTNLPGPDAERGFQPMVIPSSEAGYDDIKRYRSNNILSATLKIPWIEGLSLSGYYAYDVYVQQRKYWYTPWKVYSLDKDAYLAAGNTGKEDGTAFLKSTIVGIPEPRLTDYSEYSQSSTPNIKLDYVHTFNQVHNLEAFIAYEQNVFKNGGFDAYRRYFISEQLPYLFAGGDLEKTNSESVGFDSRMNYFGRMSYNYKNTYFFQFTFRRDGSLRFSKEHGRWGNFPSVLIGYRPSEQEWWKNKLGFINDFKLRLSYGQMGNDQISPFQYLTSYGFTTGYVFGSGLNYTAALNQTNVPNPNITWEVANMLNFGWDASFLKNKLSLVTDFFYERRSDILVKRNVSVPLFTGMTLPDENFGIVENRGLELMLTYRDTKRDFSYEASGNFAFSRNKVVEFDEPEAPVPWQTLTGHPMNSLLLYKYIGVYSDVDQVNSTPHVPGARPGDLIIQDYNDDGQITSLDRQLFALTTTPEITYGFSFNVSYKNFKLDGLIQGQSRALRDLTFEIMGSGGNYLQAYADDRWTTENTNASNPRAFERFEEYWRNTYKTDFYYADVSFTRVKNLKLSYNFPQKLLDKVKIKNANIYLSGQNLWLISTGNKIVDPETAGLTAYPIMRVVSVGAQITF